LGRNLDRKALNRKKNEKQEAIVTKILSKNVIIVKHNYLSDAIENWLKTIAVELEKK